MSRCPTLRVFLHGKCCRGRLVLLLGKPAVVRDDRALSELLGDRIFARVKFHLIPPGLINVPAIALDQSHFKHQARVDASRLGSVEVITTMARWPP